MKAFLSSSFITRIMRITGSGVQTSIWLAGPNTRLAELFLRLNESSCQPLCHRATPAEGRPREKISFPVWGTLAMQTTRQAMWG